MLEKLHDTHSLLAALFVGRRLGRSRLLGDHRLWGRFSANARRYALREFCPDRHRQQILEVARKHASTPPVALRTAAWAPWWRFEAGLIVKRNAFRPRPAVDGARFDACRINGAPYGRGLMEWNK